MSEARSTRSRAQTASRRRRDGSNRQLRVVDPEAVKRCNPLRQLDFGLPVRQNRELLRAWPRRRPSVTDPPIARKVEILFALFASPLSLTIPHVRRVSEFGRQQPSLEKRGHLAIWPVNSLSSKRLQLGQPQKKSGHVACLIDT